MVVVMRISGKMVLVSFGLLLVAGSLVAPSVAGSACSGLSRIEVLALAAFASVHLFDFPVWGLSSCLTFLGCFAQNWHTSCRLVLRVNRLGKTYTTLVDYIPSCCDLLPHTSNIFVWLSSLVALVGVDRIPVVLAQTHSHLLLVGCLLF